MSILEWLKVESTPHTHTENRNLSNSTWNAANWNECKVKEKWREIQLPKEEEKNNQLTIRTQFSFAFPVWLFNIYKWMQINDDSVYN